MSYRNKTYVIFDGDEDMWAYAYMVGWKKNENIDFYFYNAHDLNTITNRSSDDNTKHKLRVRFQSAKQVIVLIGEHTKNLYKFVRWEMEIAQNLSIPIIAVNLNKKRKYDDDKCPAILRNKYVVHISFNSKIIKHALDNFPGEYRKRAKDDVGNRHYNSPTYKELGL